MPLNTQRGQSKAFFPSPQIQMENSPPFSLSEPCLLCAQQGWPGGADETRCAMPQQCTGFLPMFFRACSTVNCYDDRLSLSKTLFHTCILRQCKDTLKLGRNYLLFRAREKEPQCFAGIEAPSLRKWHSSCCSLVVPWVVNCSKLTLNYWSCPFLSPSWVELALYLHRLFVLAAWLFSPS